MTICIAAIARMKDGSHRIVTVSDTKLTTGFYSQDMAAMKLKKVHSYWATMISGAFAQHNPVVESIKRELKGEGRPRLAWVADMCSRVYIAEGKRLAEESILGRFGLTMDEFTKSRDALGDSVFERTWGDIARIKVNCDLLMCGFDEDGAHIFVVSNPTVDNPSFITYYDSPGFAAIGSGSYLAESALYSFGQTVVTNLNETIYYATAAKFIAESASDVGENTFMLIFDKEGDRLPLESDRILESELRGIWQAEGKPKIPNSAYIVIETAVSEAESNSL